MTKLPERNGLTTLEDARFAYVKEMYGQDGLNYFMETWPDRQQTEEDFTAGARAILDPLLKIVSEQKERTREGFLVCSTFTEAFLQEELRRLHAAIEGFLTENNLKEEFTK